MSILALNNVQVYMIWFQLDKKAKQREGKIQKGRFESDKAILAINNV